MSARSSARRMLAALAGPFLVVTMFQSLALAGPAHAAVIGFGKSVLSGTAGLRPTSMQFGPDGRLYVLDNAVIAKVTVS
jgi:hypothetical protein